MSSVSATVLALYDAHGPQIESLALAVAEGARRVSGVGLPWNERMRTSGSYYGVTAAGPVTEDDQEQARALGQRVAETALSLKLARSQGINGVSERYKPCSR